MTLVLCLVYQFACLLAYSHLLGVHLVLRQVFHLNRIKAAKSAMKSDIGEVDAPYFHHLHHLTTEMKTSGRGCDSTLVLGIDGLEIIHVFGSGRTSVNNIAWQRSLTKSEEFALKLFVRTVVEESQCASATGGVVDNLSHHRTITIEEQFVTYTNLACRFHQDIPQTEFGIQFPKQEHLYLGVGLFLCTIEASGEDCSVVEYKSVALVKVFDGITECHEYAISVGTGHHLAFLIGLVHVNLLTLAMEHHQPALITAVDLVNRSVVIRKCLVGWLKSHLIFWQIKSKF